MSYRFNRRIVLSGIASAGIVSRTAAAIEARSSVLVAGASGATGRPIVAALLREGFRVRGLTRDPAKAAQPSVSQIEWVKGDVRDIASLPAAVVGVAAVLCAVGAREPHGDNNPEKVDYEGVRNLIVASKQAGVRHFVLESSCNVTIPEHNFNKIFNGLLLWKMKAEDHLRASGVPFTIVRPPQLLNEPGGAKGIRIQQGDVGGPGQISRTDVAEVMVAALRDAAALNKTFEIFNDASLPVNGWRAQLATLKLNCFDRTTCGLPPRSP